MDICGATARLQSMWLTWTSWASRPWLSLASDAKLWETPWNSWSSDLIRLLESPWNSVWRSPMSRLHNFLGRAAKEEAHCFRTPGRTSPRDELSEMCRETAIDILDVLFVADHGMPATGVGQSKQ